MWSNNSLVDGLSDLWLVLIISSKIIAILNGNEREELLKMYSKRYSIIAVVRNKHKNVYIRINNVNFNECHTNDIPKGITSLKFPSPTTEV